MFRTIRNRLASTKRVRDSVTGAAFAIDLTIDDVMADLTYPQNAR
jgi:hypothetical protein